MTNATEVIVSNHTADNNGLSTSDQPSPQYHPLWVTDLNRIVRFWNTAKFTDISVQRERRVRFGIEINGAVKWFPWLNYVSPLPLTIFVPWSDDIIVPESKQSVHEYFVRTVIEIKERNEESGTEYGPWRKNWTSQHVAAVHEPL